MKNLSSPERLDRILWRCGSVLEDISREKIISEAIKNKEAFVSASGALATWTKKESTGRSPKDTYIVKRKISQKNIDWNSPNSHPFTPKEFDKNLSATFSVLSRKEKIYIAHRVVGSSHKYSLPIKIVSDRALPVLFSYNMFLPMTKNMGKSIFAKQFFTLLVLPFDKPKSQKVKRMVIAMDMDRRLGLVFGSAYLGSVKKLIFTVMNYYLPQKNILPLHCAANEDKKGHTALFLGLSGTGKTSLSADPKRALIGDDEHGWADDGIANFEYGCYAKLINLDPVKEPEIYKAVFTKRHHLSHGCIIENAMMYPDGTFDLSDDRLTPNSRVSYPLHYLTNFKSERKGNHPKHIIFLTADAYGVLPPVSKLTVEQAMLWFLMGYTSKLSGTETGVVSPVVTFSRFFGEPFMPRNPTDYIRLFEEKIKKHKTAIYLVNTGWSGGAYGIGRRMDITITREIVANVLNNKLGKADYLEDKRFHLFIPKNCPGVDANILNPKNTWSDKEAYGKQAEKLAKAFSDHFDKTYSGKNIPNSVKSQCPGK